MDTDNLASETQHWTPWQWAAQARAEDRAALPPHVRALAALVDTVLTDDNVDDIMDVANGAIAYWAEEPTPEDRAEARRLGHDGRKWIIREIDVDPALLLEPDDLRLAYARLLDPSQTLVGREVAGYILDSWRGRTDEDGVDTGEIDGDAADCLVQVACFGEVVYG